MTLPPDLESWVLEQQKRARDRQRMDYREYLATQGVPCDDDAVCDVVLDYMLLRDTGGWLYVMGRQSARTTNDELLRIIAGHGSTAEDAKDAEG